MQVSQIAELDTHAVIGGGKAHSFGMSESAEFFTVLSDTLYRDKQRAVAREVICNAWDAHIMVGKTDTAVEIKLTETELVIKDFGPGIAPDKIVPIYCVYGSSTKVADENQTGGFGLGSKAPFAYSDHFSVTSCYNGRKIVYAVSRGGVETDGKPDIREMINVPTTESGITVSIPIRNPRDVATLIGHIRTVVRQGGMKATLNGDEIKAYDYTEARKLGFGLMHSENTTESRVYVLYGTVLYPVSTTDAAVTAKVNEITQRLESYTTVILIAPPNSVGVAPSREFLSYSERTTKTIIGLLDKVRKTIDRYATPMPYELLREHVKKCTRQNLMSFAFNGSGYRQIQGILTDPHDMARRAVQARFSHYCSTNKAQRYILKRAAKRWPDDARHFRRAAGKFSKEFFPSIKQYDCDQSKRLILRAIGQLGLLKEMLVFRNGLLEKATEFREQFYSYDHDVYSAKIVLSPNQKNAIKHLAEVERLARRSNHDGNRYVVLIIRKPKDVLFEQIEAVCAKYKLGVTKLDFPVRKKPGEAKKAKKDKSVVYYDYGQIIHGGYYNSTYQVRGEAQTLADPKFWLKIKGGPADIRFPTGFGKYFKEWAKLYPKTALISTQPQEKKLVEANVPELRTVIEAELTAMLEQKDALYGIMVGSKAFFTGRTHGYEVAEVVKSMASSVGTARVLFPPKLKSYDRAYRAAELYQLYKVYSDNLAYSSVERVRIELLFSNLIVAACKEYGSMSVDYDKAEQQFKYLRPFKGVDTEVTGEVLDQLVDMIRFCQRRNKSTLIEQPLKEAA